MNDIWILGATGRAGRETASRLAELDLPLVLVGRDATRLNAVAETLGPKTRTLVAGSTHAMAEQISAKAPAVVVNTVGPFTETALPIARACPPGTHYVDLANELSVATDLLAMNAEAAAAERTVVVGAGYGVTATESVVLKLCEDRPTPRKVRVDAMGAFAEAGLLGPAVAASIMDALVNGGRSYENGRMVRSGLGADPEQITLPDGGTQTSAGLPSGELEAAHRISQAPYVVAASNQAPAGRAARTFMPLVGLMLKLGFLRRFATRMLAKAPIKAPADGKLVSWARARVEWPDGTSREGWLRSGEVLAFAASVTADVAARLARGEGRPGAYTPCALFGAELVENAGAHFILD